MQIKLSRGLSPYHYQCLTRPRPLTTSSGFKLMRHWAVGKTSDMKSPCVFSEGIWCLTLSFIISWGNKPRDMMFLPRATSWQVVEKDLLLGLSFSAEILSSGNKLFMMCSCPKHPTATGVTLETPDLSHHTFIFSSPPTHPSIHLLIIHPSICHPFIHLPTHIFTSVYKSTYPSIHPANKLSIHLHIHRFPFPFWAL